LGYFGRGLREKPKSSCFDTNSMFCDENLPSEWFFTDVDRLLFAGLYHLATGVLRAMKEAVIRWHPAGFWAYWRGRSGRLAALDLFVVPTLSFPLCPLFTQSGRCAGRLTTL
jgi:hypothetical protein